MFYNNTCKALSISGLKSKLNQGKVVGLHKLILVQENQTAVNEFCLGFR
jgi:hypothetical protein